VGDEVEEEIIVFFIGIENLPISPGCLKYKINAEGKKCFAVDMGVKGKILDFFAINNKGYVTVVKTRNPDSRLEKEASRIVTTLPELAPGMQTGKSVTVPYSIPIYFKILVLMIFSLVL